MHQEMATQAHSACHRHYLCFAISYRTSVLPYSTFSILTNLSFGVIVQIHVGAASKFCMQPPSKSRASVKFQMC